MLKFKDASPFDHCVVDNFFDEDLAKTLEAEFLGLESQKWFKYDNAIEKKNALNDWNAFPPATYKVFSYLNSPDFTSRLSDYIGVPLVEDPGLHGGGWHIHGPGGNLNPHLDYSIHPKLGLQRKINIIVYLSSSYQERFGGHLGFWDCVKGTGAIGQLVKEIEPKFNRAVIFDTTQDSWHGLSRMLVNEEGVVRRSLAVYYLCEPSVGADPRGRALYSPRESQIDDEQIHKLIELRSGISTSLNVYSGLGRESS
jgi:Rps23 Pro-64 3,4-dihydroxylase Tpa1-like proline 4-hydroxylase